MKKSELISLIETKLNKILKEDLTARDFDESYSYDRIHVGEFLFTEYIKDLKSLGYTDPQIEWIMNSNWMRWFYDKNSDSINSMLKVHAAPIGKLFTNFIKINKKKIDEATLSVSESKKIKEDIHTDDDAQTKKNFIAFTKELEKLSKKYGVVIQSVGGVEFGKVQAILYSNDYTSGDLLPTVKWA